MINVTMVLIRSIGYDKSSLANIDLNGSRKSNCMNFAGFTVVK